MVRGAIAAFMAAGAAALLLTACETMSRAECESADWRALGYADGAGGADRFEARQSSCARRGLGADLAAYRAGAAEGFRAYCTPENGFRRGLSGASYTGFCARDLEPRFLEAHAAGRRAFSVLSALQQAEAEVRRLEARRDEIDADIGAAEDALRAAATEDERARLRNELGRLNDARRRVNDDIRTENQEVRWRSEAVERVRYEIGDRWGAW